MPTIIDSLIVTLGLDSSKFKAGQADVEKSLKKTGGTAKKTSDDINKSNKSSSAGFETVAKSAMKFLAVIGGTAAIKHFITQQTDANSALELFSKNLQQSVEDISAWSNAVELSGGNAEGLQGTLDMLSRSQTDVQLTGESSLVPYLAQLGVAFADANGHARDTTDILLDLADRFSRMDRRTAFNMGRAMGIDPGTMNLLLKGRAEVELMIKRQKEFGAVTKKQAEEALKYRTSLIEIKQGFAAVGRELLSSALPALEWLADVLKKGIDWMRDNKETVEVFFAVLATGLAAIGIVSVLLDPLALAVVAVIALAAAIALLYQDYMTWKRGGDSLIDWGEWEPGISAAIKALKVLADLFGDLVYRGAALIDMLDAVSKMDWSRLKFAAGEVWNGRPEGGAAPGRKPMGAGLRPKGGAATSQQAPAPMGGGSARDSRGKLTKAEFNRRRDYAMAYFQSQGWTKEQAAGIVAGLISESGLDETALGDHGHAYGVGQWQDLKNSNRQGDFRSTYGKDIKGASYEEQLAFVQYEMTQGKEKAAGDALRRAKSAAQAGETVSRRFERPKEADREAAARAAAAEDLFKRYPGAAQYATAIPASAPTSVSTKIDSVNVYTQATDAKGIAKDMGRELDFLFTANANYGMR